MPNRWPLGLLLLGLSTPLFSAQFAYIPINVFAGEVFVINTDTQKLVTTIPVGTFPFVVAIHPNATRVYVSQRAGANADIGVLGSVGIIDAVKNRYIDTVENIGDEPAGLVVSPDGNTLFVSHRQGITAIVIDEFSEDYLQTTPLSDMTYTGNALAITPDEDYLLATGIASVGVYGISVIAIDSWKELTNTSLDKGAMGISTNAMTEPFVYVANRITDTVSKLRFERASLASVAITVEKTFQLEPKSGPYDVAASNNGNTLYVTNSGLENFSQSFSPGNATDIANGSIAKIDINNDSIEYFTLRESIFTKAAHPYGIAVDASGDVFFSQNIWGQTNGSFVTILKDNPSGLKEKNEIQLNGSSIATDADGVPQQGSNRPPGGGKTLVFGNFIGPECEVCPTGIIATPITQVKQIRPAAITFYDGIIFLGLFLLICHRKYRHS